MAKTSILRNRDAWPCNTATCSRTEQVSLPGVVVQCLSQGCNARGSSAPPKLWITVPTALSSDITQQLAIKSHLHSCTWISLFPRKAKRDAGICQQQDLAVASADFRFSPVERQSQTSAEGPRLWCQWTAQTSAGSQLWNVMKSNINTKTRWCTTYSVVLFCIWGEGGYWERWRWPLSPCCSDWFFSTSFWLLLKYNAPFHEAALGNQPRWTYCMY